MSDLSRAIHYYISNNDALQLHDFMRQFGKGSLELLQDIGTEFVRQGWVKKLCTSKGKPVWLYNRPEHGDWVKMADRLTSLIDACTDDDPKAKMPLAEPERAIGIKTNDYLSFCKSIGVKLGDGQLQVARCAYDGHDATGGSIFGDYVGPIDTLARQIVVAVCGARGGKTRTLIALRILYGALVRDLQGLGKGEEAFALIVAPRLPLAKQALRYISGEIAANDYMAGLVSRETSESITLKRDDGGVVTIIVMPATAKGTALRGMSLTDAAFDESAFFRDSDYQISDVELFKAVSPRIMTGGQMIIASTPWAKQGLLWDYFDANYGKPQTAIAVHAPSLSLRYDKKLEMLIELERRRDPDNAKREYDAEFLTIGTGTYFDSAKIDTSIDNDLNDGLPYNPKSIYAAGADFGFVNDSSALVVVEFDGKFYKTAAIVEIRPDTGPLKPSDVVACFASVVIRYGIRHIVSDIHYREAIRELLAKDGIDLISSPDGRKGKIESYARAKSMLNEDRIRIPNSSKFTKQIKEIKSHATTAGGLMIEAPRRAGGHGDIVSAWVLAIWRQTHSRIIASTEPKEYNAFAPIDYAAEEKRMHEEAMAQYGGQNKEDY